MSVSCSLCGFDNGHCTWMHRHPHEFLCDVMLQQRQEAETLLTCSSSWFACKQQRVSNVQLRNETSLDDFNTAAGETASACVCVCSLCLRLQVQIPERSWRPSPWQPLKYLSQGSIEQVIFCHVVAEPQRVERVVTPTSLLITLLNLSPIYFSLAASRVCYRGAGDYLIIQSFTLIPKISDTLWCCYLSSPSDCMESSWVCLYRSKDTQHLIHMLNITRSHYQRYLSLIFDLCGDKLSKTYWVSQIHLFLFHFLFYFVVLPSGVFVSFSRSFSSPGRHHYLDYQCSMTFHRVSNPPVCLISCLSLPGFFPLSLLVGIVFVFCLYLHGLPPCLTYDPVVRILRLLLDPELESVSWFPTLWQVSDFFYVLWCCWAA